MKSLGLLAVLLTTSLSALPLGNPSEPLTSSRFRIGYYGDYVNHIAMNKGINNKMSTSGLQLTMNCFNRIDIFCITSLSKIRLTPKTLLLTHSDETSANQFFYMNSNPSSSFSAGARAVIYSFRNLIFGIEGQFFQMHPKAQISAQTITSKKRNWAEWIIPYQSWQIGNALSYRIGKFVTPYTGLKWQWAKYDFSDAPTADNIHPGFSFADLQNLHNLSYTIGLAFANQDKWNFSIESSIVNEKSLGLTAQYKF